MKSSKNSKVVERALKRRNQRLMATSGRGMLARLVLAVESIYSRRPWAVVLTVVIIVALAVLGTYASAQPMQQANAKNATDTYLEMSANIGLDCWRELGRRRCFG